MKGEVRLLMAITACCPLGLTAQGITAITNPLDSLGNFKASTVFEVWLPSAHDPVVYDVRLTENAAKADSLLPCEYLIDWHMDTPSGPVSGFSAYYDGHHYRYRGDRLQEYHMEWDATPFMPRRFGTSSGKGVQHTAQFADLLPSLISGNIKDMENDSNFIYSVHTDTLISGNRVRSIEGVRKTNGYDGAEFTYIFDYVTGRPLSIELNNNPGSISEQLVTVKYSYADDGIHPDTINERTLMALYPEIFEKCRESNFRIGNLPGQQMLSFTAPTVTGERYAHQRGEGFRVPTIIAILDTSTGDPRTLVSEIRQGIAALPFDAEIIWAFTSSNIDDIVETVGHEGRLGEYVLMNAHALARDTGVTAFPALILSEKDGTVKDIILGYNNDMSSLVIQKMALMRH